MLKRLDAKVFGRVHGVYFRDTTRRVARRLGLSGWVRNEMDGTVRVVAEGSEEAVRDLETFLRRGPSAAIVERVETNWGDGSGEFGGFTIRF